MASNYPLPAFYFQVRIDGISGALGFQKVSGLEAKTNFISYSHGNTKQSYDYNIAGRTVYTDATLEKEFSLVRQTFLNGGKIISVQQLREMSK